MSVWLIYANGRPFKVYAYDGEDAKTIATIHLASIHGARVIGESVEVARREP